MKGEEIIRAVTWHDALEGLKVFVIGLAIAAVVWLLVGLFLKARHRGESSRRVLGKLVFWIGAIIALLAALTVIFPSINPVDVLGGLGVVSIAAGIAFQTVLGNMFAGIVILSRDQFRVGDQVKVEDNGGTITAIHLSSTTIRRFDGQLVIVPNTVMHSSQIIVQTGFETTRATVPVAISTSADLERARTVAEETMRGLDLALNDPQPRGLYTTVGVEDVTLELIFWSGSTRLEAREATDAVITAVMQAFAREEIPLSTSPFSDLLSGPSEPAKTARTQANGEAPPPSKIAGAKKPKRR